MRKTTLFLAAASASLLAGCGSSGLLSRERPDELFIDTVARVGIEPFKERVYAVH